MYLQCKRYFFCAPANSILNKLTRKKWETSKVYTYVCVIARVLEKHNILSYVNVLSLEINIKILVFRVNSKHAHFLCISLRLVII